MFHSCRKSLWLQFAFPDCNHVPREHFKVLHVSSIPLDISSDFVLPKDRISLWYGVISASSMSMPETSVDENAGAVLRQHDVRRSWKRANILAEAEASSEQFSSQHDFGYGVPRPYVRHAFVPLLFCHLVGHCAYPVNAVNLYYLSRICRLSLNDNEPSFSFMICAYSCLVVLARSR